MKKKLKLKKWVKQFLVAILFFIVLFVVIFQLYKIDQGFIKNCTANGYSETYCMDHK